MDGIGHSQTLVLPGIHVDIPFLKLDLGIAEATDVARCGRKGVSNMVRQAFSAGVHGIVISREYTEMEPENLSGVGHAIHELGLKT
jgi:hypothetical protein